MNASPEIFVRTADLSLHESAIPRGEVKAFAQIKAYVELMRQQKKEVREIAVFGSTYNAILRAVNKGREQGAEYSGLSFKGVPLKVGRCG